MLLLMMFMVECLSVRNLMSDLVSQLSKLSTPHQGIWPNDWVGQEIIVNICCKLCLLVVRPSDKNQVISCPNP